MTVIALLVVVIVVAILFEFSSSTLLHAFKVPCIVAFLGSFRFPEISYIQTYFQEFWCQFLI